MFRNSRKHQERWFLRLSILAIVLALTIATVLVQASRISSLTVVESTIDAYAPYMASLRLTVIVLVAFAWPKLIQRLEHRGRISQGRTAELMALRWRIVSWLLIIELLIGQNLISRALGPTDGGAT